MKRRSAVVSLLLRKGRLQQSFSACGVRIDLDTLLEFSKYLHLWCNERENNTCSACKTHAIKKLCWTLRYNYKKELDINSTPVYFLVLSYLSNHDTPILPATLSPGMSSLSNTVPARFFLFLLIDVSPLLGVFTMKSKCLHTAIQKTDSST